MTRKFTRTQFDVRKWRNLLNINSIDIQVYDSKKILELTQIKKNTTIVRVREIDLKSASLFSI